MGHASSAMSANHKKIGFAFFSCIDEAFQRVAYQHQGFDSQSAAPEFVRELSPIDALMPALPPSSWGAPTTISSPPAVRSTAAPKKSPRSR